jgi:hypothetical protein
VEIISTNGELFNHPAPAPAFPPALIRKGAFAPPKAAARARGRHAGRAQDAVAGGRQRVAARWVVKWEPRGCRVVGRGLATRGRCLRRAAERCERDRDKASLSLSLSLSLSRSRRCRNIIPSYGREKNAHEPRWQQYTMRWGGRRGEGKEEDLDSGSDKYTCHTQICHAQTCLLHPFWTKPCPRLIGSLLKSIRSLLTSLLRCIIRWTTPCHMVSIPLSFRYFLMHNSVFMNNSIHLYLSKPQVGPIFW